MANVLGLNLVALSLGLLATKGIYARASSGQARVLYNASFGGARTSAGCALYGISGASPTGADRTLSIELSAVDGVGGASALASSEWDSLLPVKSMMVLMCLIA
jgi:hypothetical protein